MLRFVDAVASGIIPAVAPDRLKADLSGLPLCFHLRKRALLTANETVRPLGNNAEG
jgi:hypothetical protein